MGSSVLAEQDVQPDKVGIAVSVMLLGSISFMMSLFYLVNHPDQDMKMYSWQVISQTISIFCAVLLFQGVNGLVEDYILDGHGHIFVFVVSALHMILWFMALQFVLAVASGAVGPAPDSLEEVELQLKCWAVLFAHLTGFSAINAWGSLQHVTWFSSSPLSAFLAVPIGGVGLSGLYYLTNTIRERISASDDGEVDAFEEKWDEEAEEAENDIAGLSLSFLTVQCLRFQIGGVLPNVEGVEPVAEAWTHPSSQVWLLTSAGIAFAAITVALVMGYQFISNMEYLERALRIAQNFCSMGFAWCLFYGAKWGLSAAGFTQEETLLRVCLAMFLSLLSFAIIFVLDKIADMDATGAAADEAIRTIIEALGILVGFSWEQSFDVAVDSITQQITVMPASVTKLLMSLCLVAIVLPAWRIYILQSVLILEEELQAKEDQDTMVGYQELADKCESMRHASEKVISISEHELDLEHLEIKQMRRVLRGELYPGLKHFRVTMNGISEVKQEYKPPTPK